MEEKITMIYLIIGKMLREIRLESGRTLEQVSAMMGLIPKSLQRYETGERKINIDTLIELTSVYGVDYYEFMKEAQKRKNIAEGDITQKKGIFVSGDDVESIKAIQINPKLRVLVDEATELKKDYIDRVIDFAEQLNRK